MAKQWKPKGTIKSKLLPIEIAANDYWEAGDDNESPTVVRGKKRYFTYDEAMAIEADGWRLPTRTEWMALCIEFGEKGGDIDPSVLNKTLKLKKNGAVYSGWRWGTGNYGCYWSSTAGSSASLACTLSLYPGRVNPSEEGYRHVGFSARLVRDVKE